MRIGESPEPSSMLCRTPARSSSSSTSSYWTEICFDPRRGGGESDVIPRMSGDCSGGGGSTRVRMSNVGDRGVCGGVDSMRKKLGSFWNVMIGSPIGVGGRE